MIYHEYINPMGKWCPCTSQEGPARSSSDGVKRKVRAAQEIAPGNVGLPLSVLEQIYGVKE